MPRIVIVGAGISGLALAYRLRQRLPGCDLTLLEQRSRPGGTVRTDERAGFRIEAGPNGFLDNKPGTLTLCRDLGLGDRLIPASLAAGKNRYLFLDGRLRLLPNGLLSFLGSDLLSWRGKISLLMERFRPPGDGRDESIDGFTRRRAGREVAEVFADAFVTGIHAGDPNLLSVRAAFPRLAALEAEYGSVLKGLAGSARKRRAEAAGSGQPYQRTGQMWSFQVGLQLLIDKLVEGVPQPLLGVNVRSVLPVGQTFLSAKATADRNVCPTGKPEWLVRGDGQDAWHADAVVLTCPAYQQAALLTDLDGELAEKVAGIAYARVTVVGLGYRRADVPHTLDGFGYIAPQRTRRDLLGVQWCSSIFPGRAPEGMVLLRALCGGWHRPDVAAWDDGRLLAAMRAELRLALGIRAEPVLHHVVRWERAIPQYHLGHLERVGWIEERLKGYAGLWLGGNAYQGVALNDCTEQAGVLAERVGQYLQRPVRA